MLDGGLIRSCWNSHTPSISDSNAAGLLIAERRFTALQEH